MLIKRHKHGLEVIRTADDPKIHKETEFWHKLKVHLNTLHGMDLIKKLMYKDGHMVDDHQYYLRDRKWNYCIYDGAHALRFVYEPYNEGFVMLNLHTWPEDNSSTNSRQEKLDVETN